MLRYLRPQRGIRLVWVDAICINQNSFAERNAQVAKMGSKYQQSWQVVVYLGQDIVQPSPKRYSTLHELREIDNVMDN
jgi:hypothetical protein